MLSHVLAPDTQATLLLHAHFGRSNEQGPDPLTPTEYNRLARALQETNLRPQDLFEDSHLADVLSSESLGLEPNRIKQLLDRGAAMAFAVESWTNMGLWVMSRSDERYPRVLKERIGAKSPPLLFGAGDHQRLAEGGIVMVGSRDVDEAGLEFTARISVMAARQHIQVISGAARGVDKHAMLNALESEGNAVGVTPGRLRQEAVSRDFRPHLASEMLTLVSPFQPEAPFSVGNAMARNKVVYGLGTWAVVVNSAKGEGGTWAGAIENLKNGWTPIFVRSGSDIAEGNRELVNRGAFALDTEEAQASENISELLASNSERQAVTSGPFQENEAVSALDPGTFSGLDEHDLFRDVWPRIGAALSCEMTLKVLCEMFNVRQGQMQDWLQVAEDHGLVEKRSKPARYVLRKQVSGSGQMSFLDS